MLSHYIYTFLWTICITTKIVKSTMSPVINANSFSLILEVAQPLFTTSLSHYVMTWHIGFFALILPLHISFPHKFKNELHLLMWYSVPNGHPFKKIPAYTRLFYLESSILLVIAYILVDSKTSHSSSPLPSHRLWSLSIFSTISPSSSAPSVIISLMLSSNLFF